MTVWTEESYIFYSIIIRITVQMIYLQGNPSGGRMFFIPSAHGTFLIMLF